MSIYNMIHPLAPMRISAEQLNNHIFYDHLGHPDVMRGWGVPRFDIEAAEYRGISLQKVANRISDNIRFDCKKLFTPTYNNQPWGYLIAQSLLYMQELDLAEVDWETIGKYIPNAKNLELIIDHTTTSDRPFIPPTNRDVAAFDQFLKQHVGYNKA